MGAEVHVALVVEQYFVLRLSGSDDVCVLVSRWVAAGRTAESFGKPIATRHLASSQLHYDLVIADSRHPHFATSPSPQNPCYFEYFRSQKGWKSA